MYIQCEYCGVAEERLSNICSNCGGITNQHIFDSKNVNKPPSILYGRGYFIIGVIFFCLIVIFYIGIKKGQFQEEIYQAPTYTEIKNGQLQEEIYQAPPDDLNLTQWRKNWKKAGDSIVNVNAIINSSEKLFVFVDYIYSGSHGDKVTTCGSIIRNDRGGNWSCSPTNVEKGRGFVTLRFGLSSKARVIECSDEIAINYYDKKGVTFFEYKFPFQKIWVKNGDEKIYGKINGNFSICP